MHMLCMPRYINEAIKKAFQKAGNRAGVYFQKVLASACCVVGVRFFREECSQFVGAVPGWYTT